MNTNPEMNADIVGVLRTSGEPHCMYAAARIEELQEQRQRLNSLYQFTPGAFVCPEKPVAAENRELRAKLEQIVDQTRADVVQTIKCFMVPPGRIELSRQPVEVIVGLCLAVIQARETAASVELADLIVEQLFTLGNSDEAQQLVLKMDNGAEGGGWGKLGVRDTVLKQIAKLCHVPPGTKLKARS